MARTNRAKKRLTLLLILLIGAGVVVGGGYASVRWYRSHKADLAGEEGRRLFEEGKYAEALPLLSYYVGANHQKDTDAVLRLAKARAEVSTPNPKQGFVDATRFYSAALQQRPGSVEALTGLVRCYQELGYGTELGKAADQLLRLEPKNAAALEARLLLAVANGDWDEAPAVADRLIEAAPDVYKWRLLALRSLRQSGGDLTAQETKIRGWMKAGEPDGRYRLFLADTLRSSGDLASAKAEARRAAELGMPDTQMLGVLLDVLDSLELTDVAAQAVESAAAKGLDRTALATMQVRRHWFAGRFDEATKEIGRTPLAANGHLDPALLRWQIILAESVRDQGTADRAIAELRELMKADDALAQKTLPWLEALVAATEAESSERRADGGRSSIVSAMTKLAQAVDVEQKNLVDGDTLYLLLRAGDLAMRSGELDQAVRHYKRAFERTGGRWALAGVRASHALLAVGRSEEAFRLARELVVRFPANPPTYFVLAEACDSLLREGRNPSLVDPTLPRGVTAGAILEGLYRELKDDPSFLPPLVSAKISEGQDAAARTLAESAMANPKTTASSLLQLVGLLSDRRFGDAPERALAAAKERGADPVDATVANCRLLIARGEADGARQLARSELASAKGEARSALARMQAEAAIAAGDDDAVSALAECLKAGAGDPDAAAFVLAQERAWKDEALIVAAIADLRTSTGNDSSRAVLSDAARVLYFHRTDPKQITNAVIATNNLLQENPESVAALVTLARLRAAGQPPNFADAAKFMEQAVALQPGRRDLYPELVKLLQSAGNFPDANRYLQQFMRSAGDDPEDGRRAASLLVSQGEYLSALPALERIAASKSATEADLVALADVQRRAGRVGDAETSLKQATQRPDRTILSVLAYAEFFARSGRLSDAQTVITADAALPTPALTPANRAYILARLELDYGDPKSAGAAVAEAVRLAPNAPGVALLDARHRLASGDLPGALATARAGLGKAPDDQPLINFVSSMVLADTGSRSDTEKTFAALKETNRPLFELLTIVQACEGPGGTLRPGEKQLKELNELTNTYPSFAPAWVAAVELHAAAGRVEEAIRIAKRAMSRLPGESGPAELAARLLLREQRIPECREAARIWRSLTAESPLDADLVLAQASLLDGKPADASASLANYAKRLAIEAEARPGGLTTYAVAQLLDGKSEAAFATVKDHLAILPVRNEWLRGIRAAPTPLALDALARTEAIIGSTDDGRVALAAEYAAIAVRRDGKSAIDRATVLLSGASAEARDAPVTKLLAADLTAAKGQAAAASAAYQSVWESIPPDVRERLLKWNTLDEKAKSELAVPRSIAIYAGNNQASALAHAGVELDVALGAIDRVLLLDSDNGSLLDTKSTVHLARKEIDVARTVAEKAITLPGAGPELSLTLARIEIASGRWENARRHAQTAEREIAGNPFADRALIEQLADVRKAIEAATQKAA